MFKYWMEGSRQNATASSMIMLKNYDKKAHTYIVHMNYALRLYDLCLNMLCVCVCCVCLFLIFSV